jgi:hypothetical protein
MWQSVAVKATKSEEVRARVEPFVVLALDQQALNERLDRPDIVRKAIWDYLVKSGSPVIAAVNGRNHEGC